MLQEQHVRTYNDCMERVERVSTECIIKVDQTRRGFAQREAKLGTTEQRCREMLVQLDFHSKSSLRATDVARGNKLQRLLSTQNLKTQRKRAPIF